MLCRAITKILFGLMFLAPDIFATEFNYNAAIEVASYENINHVANPVTSEYSEEVRAGFSIVENTENILANIDFELAIIDYEYDQADDRVDGFFDSRIEWVVYPSRLTWFLSNTYSQMSIDSLLSDTPGNNQDTNALSTGPDYQINLNRQNKINIEMRYDSFYFEETNADNDRVSTAIRWLYDRISSLTIGLNYEIELVYFDHDSSHDFDRSDSFISLDYKRGRNSLQLELGLTNITAQYIDDILESRYSMIIFNERTRASSISFEMNYAVEDTGRDLLEPSEVSSIPSAATIISSDLFVQEEYRLGYHQMFRNSNYQIYYTLSSSDYKNQNNLDQSGRMFSIEYSRELSRGSRLTLEAEFSTATYDALTPLREDDNYQYRAVYSYNARRNMNLDFQAISEERDSTVASFSYDDLRMMISLVYFTG
ncbi:MAG: hypothetical protein OQK76_01645 [Gammaproteobacteria bacterium]|nr:hypothetical protein [Gammaproteobacteria bacterium]MCW9005915.1 hypothetical protein [Gammaproteobacteria bacterium]MCW9055063.1 hypothetical protein [Gammaproteobacteria bacterium]